MVSPQSATIGLGDILMLQFLPARKPGVQLSTGDLFKLFFSEDAVETLCWNTNKQSARNSARDAKYR